MDSSSTERNANERIILQHIGLILGVTPVFVAGLRIVLYAGGDHALLTTLLQTLNVPAILLGTLVPSSLLVAALLVYALIADNGLWAPLGRQVRSMSPWTLRIAFPLIAVVALVSELTTVLFVLAGLTIAGLVRWWGVRRVRRLGRASKPWIEDGMTLVALFLPFILADAPMWLPAENVELSDEPSRTVFVLSVSDEWATLLTPDRQLLRVPSEDMESRTVCNFAESRSLLQLLDKRQPHAQCSHSETGSSERLDGAGTGSAGL